MKNINPESQRIANDNAKLVISATDDQMYWFFMGSQYFLQVFSVWLTGIATGEMTAEEADAYFTQRILNAVSRNRDAIMQDFLIYPWYEMDFKTISVDRLREKLMAMAEMKREKDRTEGVHGPLPNVSNKPRSLFNILFNWAKEKAKLMAGKGYRK